MTGVAPGPAPWTRPVLLVVEERGRLVVARRCPAAAGAGVAVGMGLAEARALLPDVAPVVEPHDPRRDLETLRAVAAWADRFAPLVALDPPDGLLLDGTGCAPLFHGEEPLLEALVRGVARSGLAARAAAAATAGCAWAVARFAPAPRTVVATGAERETLSGLPVVALRVGAQDAATLAEVGVERVGDLLALPRSEVAARVPAAVLVRLDQALGHAEEALVPYRPRPVPRVEHAFPGPVSSLEGVRATVRRLLEALVAELVRAGLAALAVEVLLDRADAPPVRLVRALSRRTTDARHLAALLDPAVETAPLGHGVDRVEVLAPRTARAAGAATGALDPAVGEPDHDPAREPGPELAALLDALAGRLGPAQVVRVEPVATHVPEAAFRTVPVLAADGAADDACAPRTDATPVVAAERPSLLYDPPEAVEVLPPPPACADDGDAAGPVAIAWRGEVLVRARATGPERIAPRWWEHGCGPSAPPFPEGARDYVVWTSTRGRRLWLYGETATDRWFVHGEWA